MSLDDGSPLVSDSSNGSSRPVGGSGGGEAAPVDGLSAGTRRQARQERRRVKRDAKQAEKQAAADAKRERRQARRAGAGDVATDGDGAGRGGMPARAARTRRQLPDSTRRLLLVIVGVFVLAGSVVGFYFTSDAFDERVPVLVAARDIADGETVSAADFTSALLVLDASVPHEPYDANTPLFYDGLVATQPIPAGGLVRFEMVRDADSGAEGSELEVIVPLDLSLATQEVNDGDVVLLADPGAEPTEADPGRPRRVALSFTLTNFDGSRMRLFLPPEEWAAWEALLEEVGGSLMVVPLGDGGDPDELAQRLDAVWQAQWSADADAIAQALAAAGAAPVAGPGELEVIVSFDTSLVPTGFAEGDVVLLVDPGAEPLGNDPGRPRMVIGTLELTNYADGQMRMFVPPEEWLYWRSLADDLGATPMVLPVPEGTDIDDMSARLDAQWQEAWERSVADSGAGG